MRKTGVLCVVALLGPAAARAQFVQYIAPGSLAEQAESRKEAAERAMEAARWRVGPLRLAPSFELKNLGYLDNVYGTETDVTSDYTATVAVGLSAYLPVGQRFLIGAFAVPEYDWWRYEESRRGWREQYGASMFGTFSGVTLEVDGSRVSHQGYASSQLETPVTIRGDRGAVSLEVPLFGRLAAFGAAQEDRSRYDFGAGASTLNEQFHGLDRTERFVRGGLRYYLRADTSIGFGYEESRTDFEREIADRSNRGTAPLVELQYRRGGLGFSAVAAFWTVEPVARSSFRKVDQTTGEGRLAVGSGSRSRWSLYGARALSYTVDTTYGGYSVMDRGGLAWTFPLGWRLDVQVFGEVGRDHYVAAALAGVRREDDVRSWGAQIGMRLGRQSRWVVMATRSSYDSNVGGESRSILRVQTNLQLGTLGSRWW
jgi:hypothetical protein